MPEIRLDRTRIVTIVRELVAARMAQHVGMRLDAQIGHEAARRIFPRCWFNEATTEAGRDALGYYPSLTISTSRPLVQAHAFKQTNDCRAADHHSDANCLRICEPAVPRS